LRKYFFNWRLFWKFFCSSFCSECGS